MFSSMDVSDAPHILSDDRIVTAIRAIIRQELARALDVQQKDKLLTVDEAAEMLSLAVPTVYKLVNQNKIPFMKRTKRLYFSEQRLNDWLLRSQTQTDDERFGAVDTYLVKRRSRKNNRRA